MKDRHGIAYRSRLDAQRKLFDRMHFAGIPAAGSGAACDLRERLR